MTSSPLIILTADTSALTDTFDELSSRLAELRKRVPELVQRIAGAIHAGAELVAVQVDGDAASAAGEIRVVAKPSDRLAALMAALRTGDFDLGVIEQAVAHFQSPSSADTTMVNQFRPGEQPGRGCVPKGSS